METIDPSAGGWRSYRCPVCSHTDGVLVVGADAVLISCSHCDTPLEANADSGWQTAAAKVAGVCRQARERA